MKYLISHLPNTQKALNFKVRSQKDTKSQTVFNIHRDVISDWGNPLESKLKLFMIAYVKKNGWAKEPVSIDSKKAPKSLNKYLTALNLKK